MSLTLTDLLSAPHLKLRTVGSATATIDTAIAWAAVTEMENPQPFLSGGELVLTTGVRQTTAVAQRSFVRAVKRAGAVGIGFGIGLGHETVPQPLIAEANRWGLPVVEVPYETPFIAIGKLIADSRSADHYAKLERLLGQHQVLAKALLSGGGLLALLNKLATMTRTEVALTQYGSELFSTAANPTPVNDDGWFAVALATGSRDSSTLWLRKPFDDGGIVDYAKGLISVELNNLVLRRLSASKLAGAVLQDVISGTLAAADAPSRLNAVGINPALKHHVLLVQATGRAFKALASMPLPPALDGAVTAVVNEELLIIAPAAGSDAAKVANALSHQLFDVGLNLPVGVGGAYLHGNGLRWSYFEARDAIRRAQPVNLPERLSLTSLLLASEDVPMADMAAEAVGPLVEFDQAHGSELLSTLDTYLRLDGSVAAVASELTLHRNTVRYRLSQITELTGYDPAVTADRVQLWLAMAVRRISRAL